MNIKYWIPAFISLAFSTGAVQASEAGSWHLDKGSNTIVFNLKSSPVSPAITRFEGGIIENMGVYNYDKDNQTISFNYKENLCSDVQEISANTTPEVDYSRAYLNL